MVMLRVPRVLPWWIIALTFFLVLAWECRHASGQVCSGVGHMCFRTTDCCRGCCEGYQCVDRSFPCSTDLGMQTSGSNSCDKYFCPPGQICFMVETCPPERRCPRQPSCRRFTNTDTNQIQRGPGYNGATSVLTLPGLALANNFVWFTILTYLRSRFFNN